MREGGLHILRRIVGLRLFVEGALQLLDGDVIDRLRHDGLPPLGGDIVCDLLRATEFLVGARKVGVPHGLEGVRGAVRFSCQHR